MKILVSGSTGLIGGPLTQSLEASGHAVTRLLRPSSRHSGGGIVWNPESGELDPSDLEGFDAVVHLAGENVAARRWSAAQKTRIRDSRVVGTRLLAEAIAQLERKPAVFACASATGYYGDRGDEILDEGAAVGSDFLARVTAEWEEATAPAADSGVRTVKMRTSVVLTEGGGMLSKVLPIFKLGLGGKLGSGAQYMSWISLADMVSAIEWTLERDGLSGPGERVRAESGDELGVHEGVGGGVGTAGDIRGSGVRATDSAGRDGGHRNGERPGNAGQAGG